MYNNLFCMEWRAAVNIKTPFLTGVWCCTTCHYGNHNEKVWRVVKGQDYYVCCNVGTICLKTILA